MPGREILLLRAMAAGLATVALAWIVLRWRPAGAASPVLVAGFWLLLLAPLAMLVLGWSRAGAWVLFDLAFAGIPYAVAGSWLREAGQGVLGTAYLAPIAVGLPGAVIVSVFGARAAARRRLDARRAEALRGIGRIHWRLWTGSAVVTNEEIRAALAELAATEEADGTRVAASLLGAIAPLCAARPELAEELLAYPARPLVALGFRDAEAVLHWLHTQGPAAAGGRIDTDARGRTWLAEQLPRGLPALQQALDRARAGSRGPPAVG